MVALVVVILISASAVTVDTILRLFCLIVGGVIFVIVVVGGLLARTKEFVRDPWFWGRLRFTASFLMVLVMGATTGFFFISPTDGLVEIIVESLGISLMISAVEVIGAKAYLMWRKDKDYLRSHESRARIDGDAENQGL